MGKKLYIAEKPSVAQEFARVLSIRGVRGDGYLESDDSIVTWCVGHLVTMSYPEVYDPALKRWSMNTLPFLPNEYKYQIIDSVKKQFKIVAGLLNRKDVETIYVCTDSGREGEYIYRLVAQMAGVTGKDERRVWIDSQTEEEIKRGIREAKPLSSYNALSDSAYCRAREDYLMGINFSRVLTLKFGPQIASALRADRSVISVGRVMTCVLGMVVRREREIRAFKPTPFYRVLGQFDKNGQMFSGEWKAVSGSRYENSPVLYKENGFRTEEKAKELISYLQEDPPVEAVVFGIEKKTEKKNPNLLFNLAELQNECSRRFKKSPDETLNIVQSLYEKKLVTYPRTDARVLSTAVAKEIHKNLNGLLSYEVLSKEAKEALDGPFVKSIAKSRYTDDSKITDHYAIIPTGQGLSALRTLDKVSQDVYELIVRRFLSIFYPPAVYSKIQVDLQRKNEHFFSAVRALKEEGFLKVWGSDKARNNDKNADKNSDKNGDTDSVSESENDLKILESLKKGEVLPIISFDIKTGETSAPKRYTTGSLILAMENAGQLIEDEDLRAQIKGAGIGTSATRAEILKKLQTIKYLSVNKKTQAVSPELQGELVFEVVDASMKQLLNPELTASWEKGLSYVSDGQITEKDYMDKLNGFVQRRVDAVKGIQNPAAIRTRFDSVLTYYRS